MKCKEAAMQLTPNLSSHVLQIVFLVLSLSASMFGCAPAGQGEEMPARLAADQAQRDTAASDVLIRLQSWRTCRFCRLTSYGLIRKEMSPMSAMSSWRSRVRKRRE